MAEKITDHKFRNRCGGDCFRCRQNEDNECSAHIDHGTHYMTCNRPRAEHAEIEEWSTFEPRPRV